VHSLWEVPVRLKFIQRHAWKIARMAHNFFGPYSHPDNMAKQGKHACGETRREEQ